MQCTHEDSVCNSINRSARLCFITEQLWSLPWDNKDDSSHRHSIEVKQTRDHLKFCQSTAKCRQFSFLCLFACFVLSGADLFVLNLFLYEFGCWDIAGQTATSAIDCLQRLVAELSCYVSTKTSLNSFIHSLAVDSLRRIWLVTWALHWGCALNRTDKTSAVDRTAQLSCLQCWSQGFGFQSANLR